MEIGFPFMGDRLSLCRYSWAKRLTVYSFIFSFLWVSFPRYSYSFVPAIAAVAARAVIPKVVGRVLVRRFAANDAIYTASQLTATRVFVGRAAANAAEYLPAASSYKMSGVASLFANLSDGFWYFINLSKLPQGISMIISAMATRFIIRRIPVIG